MNTRIKALLPIAAVLLVGAAALVLILAVRNSPSAPVADAPSSTATADGTTAEPSTPATSTADPTPAPTTEQTEAPTPSATGATSAYITTAGYGDVKLGSPVPSKTKDAEWQVLNGDCGVWRLGGERWTAVYTEPFGKTGTVVSMEVTGPAAIQTKSGAHIGMSRSELEGLFPSAEHPEDGLYIVKDSLGQVVFDVGDDEVTSIRVLPVGEKVVENGGHGICD